MKINFIKQIKLRIRKFFYDRYVKRYLAIDSTIFDLFSEKLKPFSTNIDVNSVIRNKNYKRIMKMLKSKAYKDYFFKAIKYNLNNKNSISSIKPFSNTVLDKISIYIAKKYIYFFNKKLYNSILLYKNWNKKIGDGQVYEKTTVTVEERLKRAVKFGVIFSPKNWNKKIGDMDSEIDRYIKETTVEERLERAVKYGIIFSPESIVKIDEFFKLGNKRWIEYYKSIDNFLDNRSNIKTNFEEFFYEIIKESSTSEKDKADCAKISEFYNKMNPEAIDKFNDFCITKRISEESSTSEKDEAIQSIITSSSTDINQEVLKDMMGRNPPSNIFDGK